MSNSILFLNFFRGGMRKKETYSYEVMPSIIKDLLEENRRLDQALLTIISKIPVSEKSDSKKVKNLTKSLL